MIGAYGDDFEPDREFIIHTIPPRFIAEIFVDQEPLADFAYATDGGEILANFQWIDARPPAAELSELLRIAALFIEADGEREPE
jgi:hypothetical protein